MALTYDRPNYTAAELNNFYEYARDQLAAQAPEHISKATKNHEAIAELEITETLYGTTIQTPEDVFRVLTGQLQGRCNSEAYLYRPSNPNDSATAGLTLTIQLKGLSQTARLSYPRIRGGRTNGMMGRIAWGFGKYDPQTTTMYLREVRGPQTFVEISMLAPDANVNRPGYVVQGADNALNIPLGDVEQFDSWSRVGTKRLGNVEQFTEWPMGQRLVAKDLYKQPYNVLYSGTVRSTADISNQVGATQTFTVPEYQSGTLRVFWNGQLQDSNTVTELSSTTFSTSFTPEAGDVVVVDYRSNT